MPLGDRKRAKQIIKEIVRQSGRHFDGKTRLFKAFYLAHLYYFNKQPGLLSDWPIARMPWGPGIDHGDELIRSLVASGELTTESVANGPYTEERYTLTGETPSGLEAEAIEAIRQACRLIEGKSGTELSDLCHEHSRSWNKGHNGDELNVYIDVIPEAKLQQDTARLQRIEDELVEMLEKPLR